MDPEVARRCFEGGGSILCMDVPQGTEMKMDLHEWQVGPLFKGIKMIPPGLHLMTWAAGHETAGAVFVFRPGDVQVWRWDSREEDLVQLADKDEADRLAQGVRSFDFDSNLGPYPTEKSEAWARLTYLIDARVLEMTRVTSGQRLSGASSLGEPAVEDAPPSNARSTPAFVSLQSQRRRADMDPAHVSKYNLDGSERTMEILEASFGGEWRHLLGQIQLSFVLFLILTSLEGLEHWKSMVALLCTCGSLTRSNPEFMSEFVRVLRRQLEQLPGDFFRDELLSDSFLRPALETLFLEAEGCAAGDDPPDHSRLLERRILRLRKVLSERFDVDMAYAAINSTSAAALLDADEQGEDAPALVILDSGAGGQEGAAAAESTREAASGPASASAGLDTKAPPPQRMSWMMPDASE